MSEPAAGIQDKLAPIPRLKSLVLTEWQNFAKKTPVDRKTFFISFGAVFVLLTASAFAVPSLFSAKQKKPIITVTAKDVNVEIAPTGEPEVPLAPETTSSIPHPLPAPNEPRTERQRQAMTTNDSGSHQSLVAAPIAALEQEYNGHLIPRVSEDGRKPWYVYSRPFDRSDPRPRISIVVGELGLARLMSEAAITDLPGSVTLAFSAFSPAIDAWMARARSLGHETLLSIPMEPLDYPISDPGPDTLLVKNSSKQNKNLLLNHLENGKGYVGLTTFSGSRFSSSPESLRSILQEASDRGLLWYDARLTPLSSAYAMAKEILMPSVRSDFTIAADTSAASIATILNDAETSARQNGRAVVLVNLSPLTLRVVKDWVASLANKDFALAPLSAVAGE